jgi:hypothetical protein
VCYLIWWDNFYDLISSDKNGNQVSNDMVRNLRPFWGKFVENNLNYFLKKVDFFCMECQWELLTGFLSSCVSSYDHALSVVRLQGTFCNFWGYYIILYWPDTLYRKETKFQSDVILGLATRGQNRKHKKCYYTPYGWLGHQIFIIGASSKDTWHNTQGFFSRSQRSNFEKNVAMVAHFIIYSPGHSKRHM